MTADDILKLLEKKHWKDVFVPGCKNGSTWFTQGLLVLDAWVMKRSWSHPISIGYEIKISREDFYADKKWVKYLDYCNEFYFVCPNKLIEPEELPTNAGLYYVSRNYKRLYQRKKSTYRNIQIPEELYRYILMCRAKILNPVKLNNG